MPLQCHHRILRAHPDAVIEDPDKGLPTLLELDLDGAGPRVERVLDQLLDHRHRPLHNLAGGNLVRYRVG